MTSLWYVSLVLPSYKHSIYKKLGLLQKGKDAFIKLLDSVLLFP